MRRVRYFLGSFRVIVPVEGSISVETVYQIREEITQTFQDGYREYGRNRRVLDTPVQPHVFVSQIRQGSLDFQVIYQALMNLPWDEIARQAGEITRHAHDAIVEIGDIAGGLGALTMMGGWLHSRIRRTMDKPKEEKGEEKKDSVHIEHESVLQTDQTLSNSNTSDQVIGKLMDNSTPQAILVLLDTTSMKAIQRSLRVNIEGQRRHLGGQIILHDMNLMMNGLSGLEQLRSGTPFCLHNAAALGLQWVNEDSLFYACAGPVPGLEISKLVVDHVDFISEPRIVRGPSINIDDLPD